MVHGCMQVQSFFPKRQLTLRVEQNSIYNIYNLGFQENQRTEQHIDQRFEDLQVSRQQALQSVTHDLEPKLHGFVAVPYDAWIQYVYLNFIYLYTIWAKIWTICGYIIDIYRYNNIQYRIIYIYISSQDVVVSCLESIHVEGFGKVPEVV